MFDTAVVPGHNSPGSAFFFFSCWGRMSRDDRNAFLLLGEHYLRMLLRKKEPFIQTVNKISLRVLLILPFKIIAYNITVQIACVNVTPF